MEDKQSHCKNTIQKEENKFLYTDSSVKLHNHFEEQYGISLSN